MGALGNLDHERFCQSAHTRIWAGEKRATARAAAYIDTMYTGDKTDRDAALKAVKPNARRLSNRKDVKGRLAELSSYAGQLAGIDSGWCSLRAKRMVEFATDKFLQGGCDISDLPGDVDVDEDGKLVKTKIKASDRIAALALLARINGYLAPEKLEHAGPGGVPLNVTFTTVYERPHD